MSDHAPAPFFLRVAESSPLVEVARTLMAEYASLPHTAGRWPTAAADIAALPQPYVRPAGILLVALDTSPAGAPEPDVALGCGALGSLEQPSVAELKRIYVRSAARRRGVGKAITLALIDWASKLGYERVRLDTLSELLAARALYARLGFTAIPPYRDGLPADAICLERLVRT